jgi:hypothetical protein
LSAAARFRRHDPETRARMMGAAGLSRLAEGGTTAFTIDSIRRRAQAARGSVAHHVGSGEGRLAAVPAAACTPRQAAPAPAGDAPPPLHGPIDPSDALPEAAP